MAWTDAEIHSNRDFFWRKMAATRERNSVVKAIEHGPFDFVLLDARSRDAFKFGHIAGAWCAPLEDLDQIIAGLPRDREIVTYCWGHD